MKYKLFELRCICICQATALERVSLRKNLSMAHFLPHKTQPGDLREVPASLETRHEDLSVYKC